MEPTQAPTPGAEFARFASGYPFALDDYQVEACAHVEAGAGVLVAAPTGAGKTVVGEFAVHLALAQGRKCFYTAPIKALSNQKYHDLCARHGEENVGLLTGDTSINGEASVVVMTTEVLRNMIYAGSATLANLGFVVMDEVHYLADRFRGAVWEEVILGLAESVQLVALSATVSNAEEFGAWLAEVRGELAVVVSERRPVPLFQHVMVGRRLLDLFAGEAPTARERPGGVVAVNPELLAVAREESRRVRDDSRRPRGQSGKGKRKAGYGSGAFGGASHGRWNEGSSSVPRRTDVVIELDRSALLPAIMFVFSRAGCDAAVRQLMASGVRLTSGRERAELTEIATRHVEGLAEADLEALGYQHFLAALQRGLAAHHAGLLPAFKEAVEEAFARGLVKIVFATETLALGINMPARTVVIEKLVKYNGETHADVTPGEYTQLTGRAGRRGIDVEGHAVVLWAPGLDPRAVAGLASRRTYPLKSSFAPTYNMAVNLVATVGRERARIVLEQSFAQFQSDSGVVAASRTIARNAQLIEDYLAQAGCHLGDFAEYARLREQVSRLEAEAAKARRADRRAEALVALQGLQPGDILTVTSGRHAGWAAVVDPGLRDRDQPRPVVMTEQRQLKQLSLTDFPTPPVIVGRIRIPKHFSPREAKDRRNLAAAFLSRLAELDLTPVRHGDAADADAMAEIERLRATMQAHPCHRCPEREEHARVAERAMRLERENEQARHRAEQRSNSIAKKFDRICLVLESLGYLEGDAGTTVAPSGVSLARIYTELDLVTAEAIREGVFDGLSVPQLAGVLSSIVYEARATDGVIRTPDRATEQAIGRLRQVWRRVSEVERDHGLERHDPPHAGFALAAFDWAAGHSLADVLLNSGMTAGDFVRWVRQVVDIAGQVADAAGAGEVRTACRAVVAAMRRGVVAFAPDED